MMASLNLLPAGDDTWSSTSSGSNDNYVYDVFINHRGPDVKKTLATDLYHCLNGHRLRVFLDQRELEEGENITPQINSAIRTASVHIAIFSPGYADSPWCLDELVLMVESRSKSRSTIIPVFYGVKPSELRWTQGKNGVYAQALRVLEEKKTFDSQPRYDSGTIENWRNALSVVAEIKGFDRETYNGVKIGVLQCFEAVFKLCNLSLVFRTKQLLEEVVEGVLKKVKRSLYVSKYPIGLDEKVEDFERTVSLQQHSGETRAIGIVGLGGVGKTTLAKQIFNCHRSNYKRSCFLFDVREKSLSSLQSILLKDLVQWNEQIYDIDDGTEKIKRYLGSTHAIIILDNVDHVEQLNKLFVPVKDILHPGSLILVTSRNRDVLTSSGIVNSSIYQLRGLNLQDSQELFCLHAFDQPYPVIGFEEPVEKFLDICDGLPLSLQVLGALLRGKDLEHSKAQLHKISKILPNDILSRLKISYDSLDKEEKQIFLDIACFFTGEDRDTAIRIWAASGWDESGWDGWLGLCNLENKCLVEVDSENCIRMHDHLRDLGRDIAKSEPPDWMFRLWHPTNNLLHLSDQSLVRGISMVHPNGREWVQQWFKNLAEINGSRLVTNMSGLQLLRAEGYCVESIFNVVQSQQLIWLCWYTCPYSNLPTWIPIKNLRVLQLKETNLSTLWLHESQAPLQLRELEIHGTLFNIPKSIGKLKHLEKFVLRRQMPCPFDDLKLLPDEFCFLLSLKHLELKCCTEMKSLPDSFGNLRNLQHIDLSYCFNLQMLPDSFGNLASLQHINFFSCSKLEMLPDSFGNLANLQRINLFSCSKLETLPDSFGNLRNLEHINLSQCSNLQMLPDSFGNLANLQRINLFSCSKLEILPDSFGILRNLEHINLSQCSNLQTLPNSFGNLTNLQHIDLSDCSHLEMLPESFGNITNLKHIHLRRCSNLKILPDSFGNLSNLQFISLLECSSLKTLPDSFGNLRDLQRINFSSCSHLQRLPDSFGNLSNLEHINLSNCFNLQLLPCSFGDLCNLKILHLKSKLLKILPPSFGYLRSLEELELSFCHGLKGLGDSIRMLTQLRKLKIREMNNESSEKVDCSDLAEIEALPTTLVELELIFCVGLRKIGGLCGLVKLQKLNINGCIELKELPTIETLVSLEELCASMCLKLKSIQGLGQLTKLRRLDVGLCSELKELPGIEHLNSLEKLDASECPKLRWGEGVVEQLRQGLKEGFIR